MERLDCTERKLLRRLLGYFWPRVCHNEDLYAEIDVVYRWMTRGRYQHLAPPSKVAKVNRLRFFGHILRRPADRLVQRVLKSSSGSSWKKPPGRKRKFWTEVVKEDLRTLGVDGREVRFRRIWNSDEWIDSVKALAENREGWAELCSRTAHLGEDAGNRVRRDISPRIKSIVHCSAGVGRSGTMVALEMCLMTIANVRPIDIHEIVSSLRRYRALAVQSLEQYLSLYKLVLQFGEQNGCITADDVSSFYQVLKAARN
ncbi:hypothetical protein RB195_004992 [Necator americanus]|uniref:Protein-tyrosine phosphatase n=1 Tax=Necator americanus TaxID=51031 RepID=A0ABR1BPK3_NECAM